MIAVAVDRFFVLAATIVFGMIAAMFQLLQPADYASGISCISSDYYIFTSCLFS